VLLDSSGLFFFVLDSLSRRLINDMPEGIQSTVRLFADDTIAYVTISSDADAANLQQDLDKLAEWESKWLMKFHPEKCNVLTISKKRSPSKYNCTLHRHILEHDTSAKYLGCTISSDLIWGKHISTICSKANNTISFLKRNINISNKSIKEKTYVSLVRPTLEYASSVWDPFQQNDIIDWRWFKEGLHDMLLTDTTTPHRLVA
jgi:hypothetical protein